jgi:diguanylate cyclase (GGDEF)-like protein/PAS domain S-box-containing protein
VADTRIRPPDASANDRGRAFTAPPENVQDIAYRYRLQPDPGFEYISPSAAAITGYTPEEHYADPSLGARLVFPQGGRPSPGGDPMLESAVASTFLARWVQKDGAVLWTEQRNTAVRDEDGGVIAIEGVAREITARKRAEDETRLLQALTQAIGEAADLDSALAVAIEQVCAFTGWDYGEAWMPNLQGRLLERAFTWCAAASGAGEFRARSEGRSFSHGEGLPGRVWSSRQPLWIQDVTFLARASGLRAAVAIPVLSRDEVVAVLTFYMRERREEDSGLLALVSVVAAQLGSIIQRKRTEEALRASEEKFRAVAETASDAIVVADARGEVTYFNSGAERTFQLPAREALGRPLVALLPERFHQTYQSEVGSLLTAGGPAFGRTMEVAACRSDGAEFPVELSLANWEARGQNFVTAIIRDITDRRQAEEQIRHLAFHDALTGLPNRLLFGDRLQMAINRARRYRHRVAILFVDIDRFKVINDSLGHTRGDRLLQDVAERLRDCVREDDTIARFGGDEFTLLLSNVARVEDAINVAGKILKALEAPFPQAGRDLFITPSIGVVLYPDDGHDLETLVKNADAAMYQAKEQGGNRYQLYKPALNAMALGLLTMENELHQALAREEMVVHFQPLQDLRSGRMHGVEALVRWRHPRKGLLLPQEFISLAEVTGLIVPLGQFVLRTACAQVKAWQRQGHPELMVSVNLSARQVQDPDLPRQVLEVLEATGLEPRFLDLEITENNALQSAAATIDTLARLKAAGVRISIDDFGIGYSSLSYLRQLPIDTLKIDQSFVRNIATVRGDSAIVTAVIVMAHALKLEVVAEGVETATQLAFLGARRCDRIQGFFFSPPVPPEDLKPLLAAGEPARRSARRGRRRTPRARS